MLEAIEVWDRHLGFANAQQSVRPGEVRLEFSTEAARCEVRIDASALCDVQLVTAQGEEVTDVAHARRPRSRRLYAAVKFSRPRATRDLTVSSPTPSSAAASRRLKP